MINRLFIAALLLLPFMARAQVQINSFDVLSQGWAVRWYVTIQGTNGTFVAGLGTHNKLPENPMLYIEFDDIGSSTNGPTVYSRRSYAQKIVRRPYPDQDINDIFSLGDGVVTFVTSMNERISQESSNLLAYARAGAFVLTNASGVSTSSTIAGFAFTGTNSSSASYAKAKVKMNWIPFQRIQTATEIPFVGSGHVPFRWPIRNPFAYASVVTVDETGNMTSNNVSQMRIDWSLGETIPTAEVPALIQPTNFVQGEYLTTTITVHPWLGGEAAAASLSFTNLCDRTGAYSKLSAVVDLSGVDANGRPQYDTAPTATASNLYFASINGACSFGAMSNNVIHGHNDVGGMLVYVRSGVTNFTGASAGVGGVPKSWVKILPYPGDSVSITNRSGAGDISDKVWIEDITLAVDIASITPFSSIDHLAFKNVTFNSATAAPIQNCTNVYVHGGRVIKYVAGFAPFTTQPTHFRLVRGVDVSGDLRVNLFDNWVGNYATTTNAMQLYSDTLTFAQRTDVPCLYNNFLPNFAYAGDCITVGKNFGLTNGAIIANNLFTFHNTNEAATLTFIGTAEGHGYYDIDVYFNTWEGKRTGFAYCTDSNSVSPREGWSWCGNILPVFGMKSDTWLDPGPSGLLTNNWMMMNGCWWREWARTDEALDQAAGTIWQDFSGLNCFYSTTGPGYTNVINISRFVSPNHQIGNKIKTTGGGDYNYLADSPMHGLVETPCWPYALDGRPRAYGSPPGAFVGGNPRQSMLSIRLEPKSKLEDFALSQIGLCLK